MGNRNRREGTGEGIVLMRHATSNGQVTSEEPRAIELDLGSARGILSKVAGTIKVKTVGEADGGFQNAIILPGVNLISVDIVYNDSGEADEIAYSDFQLIW